MAKKESVRFEKALERLKEITNGLESGELSLDESIKSYEEGAELVALCQKKLTEAEKKIELLVKKGPDKFTTKKFEDEELLF